MTERKLLVLDAAYTFEGIERRGIQHSVTVRDLDGFFDHVWSVHPLVGADPAEGDAVGKIRARSLAGRHTFVEGHVGRSRRLAWLPPLNLAVAQLGMIWYLAKTIRTEKISAIRVGDPYYLGIVGWFLARVNRIPLVVRINGNYDAIYEALGQPAYPRLLRSRRLEKRLERFVLRRAELVFAPNEDNLRYALDNGSRPERSHVIAFGGLADPCHFTNPSDRAPVREELGLGDAPFLACLGRLEPVKYPDDALEAFFRINANFPEAHLVLIGDGRLRDALQTRARAQGLSELVHLVGNRPQDWVARALADASVVVAPMAGRALVEASLSETPIVAYDVEWHPELIDDGGTGILVAFRDIDALSKAIITLLTQPEDAKAIGMRARQMTLELMDPEAIRHEERALYEELLSSRERVARSPS